MNDWESETAEDRRVDAVLAALADAGPRPGLEQRMVQRLAAKATARSSAGLAGWMMSRIWRQPQVIAGASLACVLVGAAMLLLHNAAAHRTAQGSAAGESAASTVAPSVRSTINPAAAPALHGPEHPTLAEARQPRPPFLGRAVPMTEQSPTHSQSFASQRKTGSPAPPMPLTEQERLLLQIAERGNPEQEAMLDRTERDRVLREEHAETDRFFQPAPLPASLQEEINAALRSQYVNTPPPRELLAQTKSQNDAQTHERSLP